MLVGSNPGYYSFYQNNSSAGLIYNKPFKSLANDVSSPAKIDTANRINEIDERGISNKQNTCETCAGRRYQDSSNDSNVSFKSPAKISPEAASSAVISHEYEHVANAKRDAEEKKGELVSQNVSVSTSICPECKKVYVSGGETRTTIRYGANGEALNDASSKIGNLLDTVA